MAAQSAAANQSHPAAVTHDQEEALDLADQVVGMNAGRDYWTTISRPARKWPHTCSAGVRTPSGGLTLWIFKHQEGQED